MLWWQHGARIGQPGRVGKDVLIREMSHPQSKGKCHSLGRKGRWGRPFGSEILEKGCEP